MSLCLTLRHTDVALPPQLRLTKEFPRHRGHEKWQAEVICCADELLKNLNV